MKEKRYFCDWALGPADNKLIVKVFIVILIIAILISVFMYCYYLSMTETKEDQSIANISYIWIVLTLALFICTALVGVLKVVMTIAIIISIIHKKRDTKKRPS